MASKRSQTVEIDPAKCREMVSTCACFNFRKASRSVTQLFDQILAPVGLRSTQLVILVASQVLGPCGLARLARELVMDRSTVTRNLHPLVTHGFLEITGKTGRSGKSVQITKAGQQALIQAVPYWEDAQRQLLHNLGRERWDRVMGDLSTVVSATRSAT